MAEYPAPGLAAYRTAARAHLPQERLPEAALAGVLTYVGRAERAIGSGNVPAAHQALITAQQIVGILRASLDHAVGGALAQTLDQLYAYILAELGRANVEKSVPRLRALVPVIAPLHAAFGAAAAQVARQIPAAAGGGRS